MPSNPGIVATAGFLKNPAEPVALGYRVNYVINPSFEDGIAGWASIAGATLSHYTDDGYVGSSSIKVTNVNSSAIQTEARIPLLYNGNYTVSAYVRVLPGSSSTSFFLRTIQYETATSTTTVTSANVGNTSISASDGWVRLKGTITKNAIANYIILRVVTSSTTLGDEFLVDAISFEYEPSVRPYFDGNFGGFWAGSANNSISGCDQNYVKTMILGGQAADASAIVSDSSGNLIAAYNNVGGVGEYAAVVKYDSNGKILWQKRISDGTNEVYFYDIEVDSENNIVVGGRTYTGATYEGLVMKLDKAGTLLWQREHTGGYDEVYAISIDFEDNVYASGSTYNSPPNDTSDIYVMKYNSSGTLQWSKQIQGTSFDEEWASATAVDAFGNYYATCYQLSDTSGDEQVYTFKLSPSTGDFVWQRYIGAPAAFEQGESIAYAPNGDIYVLAYTNNGALVARYASDGNLVFQREIADAYLWRMTVDSLSNLYLAGDHLVKMDQSGNIVWQRSLNSDFAYGISLHQEFIYLATDRGVWIVPQDGSKINTYNTVFGDYVYTESTLALSTPTYSTSTPNLNIATANPTNAAGALTVGVESLEPRKYSIP